MYVYTHMYTLHLHLLQLLMLCTLVPVLGVIFFCSFVRILRQRGNNVRSLIIIARVFWDKRMPAVRVVSVCGVVRVVARVLVSPTGLGTYRRYRATTAAVIGPRVEFFAVDHASASVSCQL